VAKPTQPNEKTRPSLASNSTGCGCRPQLPRSAARRRLGGAGRAARI
jgi:hypothetical protein